MRRSIATAMAVPRVTSTEERADLRVELAGPTAPGRLDEIKLTVLDDQHSCGASSIAGGPTDEQIRNHAWGAYQFRRGVDGGSDSGRGVKPFSLVIGELSKAMDRPSIASLAWPRDDLGMTRKYVGAVPDAEWQQLLTEFLARADEFRVHMPDGDGQLSHGRAEFVSLSTVAVRPWSGMRDAIEIVGPMTPAARDLFLRLEVSLKSFDPEHKLWDYELVENGSVVLSIGDYHDLMIEVPD
ncbi:hypothetical protein ACWEOZ_33600 [Actinoplanes sp. NPDC004185]